MKKYILFLFAAIIAAAAIGQSDRIIQLYKNNKVVQQYSIDDIDYLEIKDVIGTPKNVTATVNNGKIVVSWSPVKGAEYYTVARSSNATSNFVQVATYEETTSWVDEKPLKDTNYYKVQAHATGKVSLDQSSVAVATLGDNVMESGIYLGLLGFNNELHPYPDDLYPYPISLLTESTKDGFDKFIDGLTIDDGTILYYSVEEALNTLQAGRYPSDLFNVAMVTFTDGLDQGSFAMNYNYNSDEEYLDAINYRIKNETVTGNPINAYSIGLKGKDVSDVNKFRLNLKKLASKDENAKEVASMSEVNKEFEAIAQQLVENNSFQSVILRIPILAPGTRVRFTFDNVSSAKNSNLYIEGIFNRDDMTLTDVTYKGFAAHPGSIIAGTKDGIFVTFAFDAVQTESKKLLTQDYIDEWTYVTSSSSWQINSEFEKTPEAAQVETTYRSAAIMLVLDCSSSLGKDFGEVKSQAKNFINILLKGKSEGGNTDPGTIDPGTDYNGHEYVDLGLPSGLKWATCNIGATKPEEYGSYFAWGETSVKSSYDSSNSETFKKSISWLTSNGYLDSKGNLTMEHDAARKNWGGSWRMPTKAEIEELKANTTTTWTTQGGKFGYLVISKKNGKSIFLPAAGYRNGGSLYLAGQDGTYWSSTPYESNTDDACCLYFYSGYFYLDWNYRYYGRSVRAVSE